jgi:predicted kinase
MKKINLNMLKQPFVIIMVGPPLVGKSTAIREWTKNFKGEVTVISRDAILLEEHGSDDYAGAFKNVNQKKVNRILKESIATANDNKENVIIDMTHMSSGRRTDNLDYFDKDYYKIAVVFDIPSMEELLKRNEKRSKEENKYIPKNVIESMCESYVPVKASEGFNKIISI